MANRAAKSLAACEGVCRLEVDGPATRALLAAAARGLAAIFLEGVRYTTRWDELMQVKTRRERAASRGDARFLRRGDWLHWGRTGGPFVAPEGHRQGEVPCA